MPRYCQVPDCDHRRRTMWSASARERLESKYCKIHACRSANSYFKDFVLCDNIATAGSRFCAFHPKCHFATCHRTRISKDDRSGRFFCDQHTCLGSNCLHPATGHDKRCDLHKECARGGCSKYRIKSRDGRSWLPVCADHVVIPCYIQGCRMEIRPGSVFCPHHKCIMETCSGSKIPGRNYCVSHTCGLEECKLPISHPERVLANNPRGCFYCELHECKDSRCHIQSSTINGYCNTHGCTVQHCPNPRSSESHAGAYCIDHYTESVRRSAEQIGRDKEHAASKERQRQMQEEKREHEKELRIARQEQERFDHIKAQRDAAVEAEGKARKQAERLQLEEARRRDLEDQQREIDERERRFKRRSYDSASTSGSVSVVDHPGGGGVEMSGGAGGPGGNGGYYSAFGLGAGVEVDGKTVQYRQVNVDRDGDVHVYDRRPGSECDYSSERDESDSELAYDDRERERRRDRGRDRGKDRERVFHGVRHLPVRYV